MLFHIYDEGNDTKSVGTLDKPTSGVCEIKNHLFVHIPVHTTVSGRLAEEFLARVATEAAPRNLYYRKHASCSVSIFASFSIFM